ncbi:Spy/CpxP family protein refolding chaperone [Bdellovibrio sp. HCB274]|uniref:Spy/CpxP family protein refolding chaperone n=1 Tax=Bdellovibrio sp. HCB274 TaxID=3394361 RepID=UPI0039B66E92
MKRITQFVIAAAFVAPSISLANTHEDLTVSMVDTIVYAKAEMPDSCKQVKLTDQQQMDLRNAYLDFNTQKKPMRMDLKRSKREMKRVFTSSTSTKDDAIAAQADVGSKMMALGKLMGDFSLKVFFDILTPEQRDPAMRCLEDLK